jgi:hypothetical protein
MVYFRVAFIGIVIEGESLKFEIMIFLILKITDKVTQEVSY